MPASSTIVPCLKAPVITLCATTAPRMSARSRSSPRSRRATLATRRWYVGTLAYGADAATSNASAHAAFELKQARHARVITHFIFAFGAPRSGVPALFASPPVTSALNRRFREICTAAMGRIRAYNCETAPGHFLTLIQRAQLQTCHAINRIHEGSIERQIFAVTPCRGSFVNVKSALNTFALKRDSSSGPVYLNSNPRYLSGSAGGL